MKDSDSRRFPRRPGDLFLTASCLLMYAWCILLPLIGRAGAATPHARANFLTQLGVLLAAMVFSGAAWWRKRDADGARTGVRILLGAQILILLLMPTGAFSV